MDQSFYSKQAIAAFNYRRSRYREMYRLAQATLPALVQQRARAAQVLPAAELDEAQFIEGRFFIVGPVTSGKYQPSLKHIKKLGQAVYERGLRIIGLLVLTIVGWYYVKPWLALGLLALICIWHYYKLLKAARAVCPRSRDLFGSARRSVLSRFKRQLQR